jgi:16S rRNA A1518/A1519 N6-dimethyltransferase RsmA/KsgA/DIM1 with predicted DNA glycosylase/AP lyase activity
MFYFAIIIFSIFYLCLWIYIIYSIYATVSGAPFVPSKQIRVDKMIEMADLKPEDRVIDLGSGDGRIVLAASGLCAQADGVEINPLLVAMSKKWTAGKKNINIRRMSMWKTNLSSYNVIFVYLIPHRMNKLAQKIKKEMKSGSRVISNAFSFPDWPIIKKDGNIFLYELH